jgi:neutral ceramidase
VGAEQWWIALGGEVVVDYAALMKARFGPSTRVVGYANDAMCYIPSARVWKEGGYDSGAFSVYGLPVHRWASDIQPRILDATGRLIQSVLREDSSCRKK